MITSTWSPVGRLIRMVPALTIDLLRICRVAQTDGKQSTRALRAILTLQNALVWNIDPSRPVYLSPFTATVQRSGAVRPCEGE